MMSGLRNIDTIHDVLATESRRFQAAGWLWGFDNNQNSVSEWDTSEMKVLVVFLSAGKVKTVSNTYTVINSLIKQKFGPQVFVDNCFFPIKEDFDLYTELEIPTLFGNVSHKSVFEYDLVLVSCAVCQEVLNVPYYLKTSGVGQTYKERLDQKVPLFMGGGICIDVLEIMHGCGGLIDISYIGQAEGYLPKVVGELLSLKQHGLDLRTRKQEIIRHLVTRYDNIYFGQGYEPQYAEDGVTIKEIKPLYDWVPAMVDFHKEEVLEDHASFEKKIFTSETDNSDSADIQISWGCSGYGSCYFCHEGFVLGPWRERGVEDMIRSMKDTVRYAAPNSIGFYSFNSNYYGRFLDIITEAARRFSTLSLINMRTDIIADNHEYFKAGKALSMRRISLAVEGISERIRAIYLNKNLSREQWVEAARSVFENRFIDLKHGFILTGYETQADMEEGLQCLRRILAIRDDMGASTNIRLTFTPLVYYPNTPVQHLHRITSQMSLEGKRVLRYFIEGCRELGVRIKFNAKHLGTFVEQMIMDLGRLGTPIILDMAREGISFQGGDLSKSEGERFRDLMILRGLDPYFFLQRRPKDWIYPNGVVSTSPPHYRETWEEYVGKSSMPYCLRTSVNDDPKCTLCESCLSKEHRQFLLYRDPKMETTPDDVRLARYENKPMASTRVSFNVSKTQGRFRSKRAYAHYIASLFLRRSDDLVDSFHSIQNISTMYLSANNQKDWITGKVFFDVFWKKRPSLDILNGMIPDINKKLETAKVVKVVDGHLRDSLSLKGDRVLYRFSIIGKTVSGIQDALTNYTGKVKVADKMMARMYNVETITEDLELKDIRVYATPAQGGSSGTIIIPLFVNPFLLMSTLMNWPYQKCMENCSFSVVEIFGKEVGMCPSMRDEKICLALSDQSIPQVSAPALAQILLKRMKETSQLAAV